MVFHHTSRLRGVACAASNAVSTGADVALDRDVGVTDLVELGPVDVDVDDLGAGGEGRDLARHAVVEARAERDQEVALLDRGDRGVHAVHPGHAEVLLVRVRERASRHQRRDDRHAGALGEGQQLLGRARLRACRRRRRAPDAPTRRSARPRARRRSSSSATSGR